MKLKCLIESNYKMCTNFKTRGSTLKFLGDVCVCQNHPGSVPKGFGFYWPGIYVYILNVYQYMCIFKNAPRDTKVQARQRPLFWGILVEI